MASSTHLSSRLHTIASTRFFRIPSPTSAEANISQASFNGFQRHVVLRHNFPKFKVQPRLAVASAVEEESTDTADTSTGADEDHGLYPHGEWPVNFSMSTYEDLSHHYAPALFKKEAQPDTILADVMSKILWTAYPETSLEEVSHHFSDVTGLPVIDQDLKVVGVLSKKDLIKSPNGLAGKTGDVMSTPAITITAEKTVRDAAVLMLKNKVHRIPVVNGSNQLVGIVTRTDIFTALDGGKD